MLREQIVAIRAGAAAQVAMADAILKALDVVPPSGPIPDGCEHQESIRLAVPRMGAPNGWRCACGAEGDH